MKRPVAVRSSAPIPFLLLVLAAGLAGACRSAPQKLPPPPTPPLAQTDPCEDLVAQQKKLEESVASLDADKRSLEEEVTGLKLQLVEKETGIRELNERERALEAKLDEAIQEVVRAKSKLRSLESRAEAASNMAEAEIALKAIESEARAGEGARDLSQAKQLLTRSAEEFKNENYGGALYLANQAKGLLRNGEVRPAPRQKLAPVPGESPFEAPLPLELAKDGNLRGGPDLASRVITTLPKGTKVVGLSRKDQWIRVRDEKGATGWVFEPLLSAR
jgi:hypothetical protein